MRELPSDLNIVARFYDRWTPFEDNRRQISDDLKELFAEAKAEGLTPKALRTAFAEKYRIDNQTADQADKRLAVDADVELYLSALARVREGDDEPRPMTGFLATLTDGQKAAVLAYDGDDTLGNPVTQAAGTAGEGSDALPADTVHSQREVSAGGTAVRHMGGVA